MAPCYFDDHTNTDNLAFIWNKLCPELCPGQVVSVDTASFHESPRIREIVENAGCQLLSLRLYSPDLNPIKHPGLGLKMNFPTSGVRL
jgi:hypothetical protein